MTDMVDWKYNPEDYDPNGFDLIPVGNYRVRIEQCVLKLTKNGKQMFSLKLAVSGYRTYVWNNVVFDNKDEETRQRTNNQLGSIYDSFNIPKGNLDPFEWKGKVGGAKIKHGEFNGERRAEISYFLSRKKVDALPAWQEKGTAKNLAQNTLLSSFMTEPFNPDKGFE